LPPDADCPSVSPQPERHIVAAASRIAGIRCA
jgi:hypothetical protein